MKILVNLPAGFFCTRNSLLSARGCARLRASGDLRFTSHDAARDFIHEWPAWTDELLDAAPRGRNDSFSCAHAGVLIDDWEATWENRARRHALTEAMLPSLDA